jgi:DNA-binding NarL/FixJ family response regulator
MSDPIRVLVVDDHELILRGTVEALAKESDITVVGVASGESDGLALGHAEHPDVALIDVRLADGDGLSLARSLIALPAPPRVILITGHSYREHIRIAWSLGVRGYLLKSAPVTELVDAIRVVAHGRRAVSREVAEALAEEAEAEIGGVPSRHGRTRLTPRQRDVANLLTEGLSNREIGARLHISERTVERHVHRIMQSLRAKSRTEAAVLLATARDPGPGLAAGT